MGNRSARTANLRRGFRAHLTTHFLGAFNDNLFKVVLSLHVLRRAEGPEEAAFLVSVVGAFFILPFLVASGYAGWLADRFSKKNVIITAKSWEVVCMVLGAFAMAVDSLGGMLGVLVMMALQSASLGPSKYGILREIQPRESQSKANGKLESSTFLAIIFGTVGGTSLYALWSEDLWIIGAINILIALAGATTAWGIPRVSPADEKAKFHINPWHEVAGGIRAIRRRAALRFSALGLTFFWFIAALMQMNLILLGHTTMNLSDEKIGILTTSLALGLGAGCYIAGKISGRRVEMALVPIGSLGVASSAVASFFLADSFVFFCVATGAMGLFSGWMAVPLQTRLQQESPRAVRGRIIATVNVSTSLAIIFASVVLALLQSSLGLTPKSAILWIGVVSGIASLVASRILLAHVVRFLLCSAVDLVYRRKLRGLDNVPESGAALLVCNHVTMIDGLLIGASLRHRFVRFLCWKPYYEKPWLRPILGTLHTIPIEPGEKEQVEQSIERARNELRDGHVVCIFAEGAITRDGRMLPFREGFRRIAEGLDVPVIPVHLGGLWGSIFSFERGRFFWKRPRAIPYPASITFGKRLPTRCPADDARRRVLALAGE